MKRTSNKSLFLFFLLALLNSSVYADLNIFFGGNINFGTWNGGNISASTDYCLDSVFFNGGPVGANSSYDPINYQVRVRMRGVAATSPFEFRPGGAAVGTGAAFSVTSIDLFGAQTDVLNPNQYTALVYTGEDCFEFPGSRNLRITVDATESELSELPPGFYRARMRLQVRGGENGTEVRQRNYNVDITIGDLIRISSLDDVNFGNYTGSGDLQATQSVCIYRNGGTDYRITATGNGAANAFTLDDGGANTIPYTVSWDDGGGFTTLTTGVQQAGLTNVSDHLTCNAGANNPAQLRVFIAEADLIAAPSNPYSGVLQLMVEPQ